MLATSARSARKRRHRRVVAQQRFQRGLHVQHTEAVVIVPAHAAAQVQDQSLVRCEGGEYRPGLAESWETSPDGLRLILHLRGGVRWHDHHGFGVLDVQANAGNRCCATTRRCRFCAPIWPTSPASRSPPSASCA